MHIFLSIFFAIYGAMHLYLFLKVMAAYPQLGLPALLLIALGLVLMVLAPLGVHVLDRSRHFRLAVVVADVGYTWMAVIFWFLVLMAATDVWNLGARGLSLAVPSAKAVIVPAAKALPAIGIIIAVLLAWGLWEAQHVRVKRLALHVPTWPAGRPPITLAQVSDLHLGVNTGPRRLGRVISLLRELKPDILISTGDLVDSHLENIEPLAAQLAQLEAPLGKFAVLGNHEYYNGLPGSVRFHELAGFRLLRGDVVTPTDALLLAGVDDPAGRYMGESDYLDENAILPEMRDGHATILLKHQPVVSAKSVGRFDLQLSGHAHGGQLFPFQAFTASVYRYFRGWYDLADGSAIYVNMGAGTWGPPVRLGAPPEVLLLTVGS